MSGNPSWDVLRLRWWGLRLMVRCWFLILDLWRLRRAGNRAARAFRKMEQMGVLLPPKE